jgi:hypothetical protein
LGVGGGGMDSLGKKIIWARNNSNRFVFFFPDSKTNT